jgi:hypothetical protein
VARLEISGLIIDNDGDLDSPPTITVVLSKRNLLALLHKVDQEWSRKTITNDFIWLEGELLPVNTVDFNIIVEPDSEHYSGRETPGEMHHESEAFIAAQAATDLTH